MGSLSSRPKVPSQPQTVYYMPPPSPSTQIDTADPDAEVAEARKNNLLQRGRGRFSTIQTSFRGLLSLTDANAQRKTLLGE